MSEGTEDPIEAEETAPERLVDTSPTDLLSPPVQSSLGPPVKKQRRRGKWIAAGLLALSVFLLFTRVRPALNRLIFRPSATQPSFTPTPTEQSTYLSDIRSYVEFLDDPKQYDLRMGLLTCSDLSEGKSTDATLQDLLDRFQLDPTMDGLDLAQIATTVLCPSYSGQFS